jgi:hypothetical protein
LRILRIFLVEANFGGAFLKNRRLRANVLKRHEFHNSEHVDYDDRLGTLLGTPQKHHAKSAIEHWSDLCAGR